MTVRMVSPFFEVIQSVVICPSTTGPQCRAEPMEGGWVNLVITDLGISSCYPSMQLGLWTPFLVHFLIKLCLGQAGDPVCFLENLVAHKLRSEE